MTMSKSPQRNTFQKEKYLEREAKKGRTPENDPDVKTMVDFYDSWDTETEKREANNEWCKNNLEYDLRSTEWILNKVRSSESYAQNLYAAMCNNEFLKNEVWPVLKNQTWSCSWRYAGGIIADMLEQGDYIDWYCSGIKNHLTEDEEHNLTPEQKQRYEVTKQFVGEGAVTDEIRTDLKILGWSIVDQD